MDSVFIVTAVVATVEFLRRLQIGDYFAALTIVVSAAIGLVAGLLNAPGVNDAWSGILTGLGASGIVTVAQKINQGAPKGGL